MYTEFHFNSEIKQENEKILDILYFMTYGKDRLSKREVSHSNETEIKRYSLSHQLFKTARWACMFRCASYSFDTQTYSTFTYDEIVGSWYLSVRCNLKNYDQEIQKFINWIHPHLACKEAGDFLGFYRYEETENPTLIYY